MKEKQNPVHNLIQGVTDDIQLIVEEIWRLFFSFSGRYTEKQPNYGNCEMRKSFWNRKWRRSLAYRSIERHQKDGSIPWKRTQKIGDTVDYGLK